MDPTTDLALLAAALATLTGLCSEPVCVVQLLDRTVLALYLDERCVALIHPTGEVEVLRLAPDVGDEPRRCVLH